MVCFPISFLSIWLHKPFQSFSVRLQVEVIDFGVGIPESDFQNIFDPFITKKQDGKGLGLSIVSNSIRTLDGSIEVKSENGCTNFCLNFPLKKTLKDNYEKNFSS